MSRAAESAFIIAGAAIAILLAIWIGGPTGALFLGLSFAAGALGWIVGDRGRVPRNTEVAAPPKGIVVPSALLLDALDEPALLLYGQRIVASNRAARAALGERIDGEPIRIAIRHPAAGAVLAGQHDGPVTLLGLVDADRRWELSARSLADGTRLLRLQDRSETHVAEQMRTNFVANASHELRTPLAALIGFIETLDDPAAANDPTVRRRFLGIMAGEAQRMRALIDDLISLSRIEADRYVAPSTPVDLRQIIAIASSELRASMGETATRIAFQPAGDLPKVAGDAAQLSQLVHNVVGNALKYGRAGTPVTVDLTVTEGSVLLTVANQGDGIAPQHLPRLTERFYRVDSHRGRSAGGTGLGLAIVKHIVERHRGRLAIASTVGAGTTVSVELPVAS